LHLTLVNNGCQQHADHTSLANLSLFLVVVVLDRAHQIPLAVERQCRPRTSGVENLDCDPRRQLHGLQTNADLGQAPAALESFEVFGKRVLNGDISVNAVVLEQPIDDCDVAVPGSPCDGAVVVGRRIDAFVLQQSFDDREVAVTSSKSHGVVVVGRRIDALVLQQSFDDREVAISAANLTAWLSTAAGLTRTSCKSRSTTATWPIAAANRTARLPSADGSNITCRSKQSTTSTWPY
jgi:hypothetical protein